MFSGVVQDWILRIVAQSDCDEFTIFSPAQAVMVLQDVAECGRMRTLIYFYFPELLLQDTKNVLAASRDAITTFNVYELDHVCECEEGGPGCQPVPPR